MQGAMGLPDELLGRGALRLSYLPSAPAPTDPAAGLERVGPARRDGGGGGPGGRGAEARWVVGWYPLEKPEPQVPVGAVASLVRDRLLVWNRFLSPD